MKKCVNGKYIEMTAEEIDELKRQNEEASTIPTLEERIAALEVAMLEQLLGSEVFLDV